VADNNELVGEKNKNGSGKDQSSRMFGSKYQQDLGQGQKKKK